MHELPQGDGRTVELNSPPRDRRRMCYYSSSRPVSGMWLHHVCGMSHTLDVVRPGWGPRALQTPEDAISGKKGHLGAPPLALLKIPMSLCGKSTSIVTL